MKNNKFIKAFTLLELLVVISIIGLLSSVVMASLNTARDKAERSKTKVAIEQTFRALDRYYLDNGEYPGVFEDGYQTMGPDCNEGYTDLTPYLVPKYLPTADIISNKGYEPCIWFYNSKQTNGNYYWPDEYYFFVYHVNDLDDKDFYESNYPKPCIEADPTYFDNSWYACFSKKK